MGSGTSLVLDTCLVVHLWLGLQIELLCKLYPRTVVIPDVTLEQLSQRGLLGSYVRDALNKGLMVYRPLEPREMRLYAALRRRFGDPGEAAAIAIVQCNGVRWEPAT